MSSVQPPVRVLDFFFSKVEFEANPETEGSDSPLVQFAADWTEVHRHDEEEEVSEDLDFRTVRFHVHVNRQDDWEANHAFRALFVVASLVSAQKSWKEAVDDSLNHELATTFATVYPACREHLLSLTARVPFGPKLFLPSVSPLAIARELVADSDSRNQLNSEEETQAE